MGGRPRLRAPGAIGILLVLLAALAPLAVAQGPGRPQEPDRPAVDGRIREIDLWHDSRDDRYRTPTGAVPAGTSVRLRVRSAAGDLESATVRLVDRLSGAAQVLPMELVATDPDGGDHGFDYWEAVVRTGPQPAILDYTLVATDGASSRHLSDDRRIDGAAGQVGREALPEQAWQLTVHDPEFETPDWAEGAVVYQVFPDRFANGDPTNDPSPDATPGADGAARYRQGDVYGSPILPRGWDELPEGYCRAYDGVPCDEGPLGRDFFGGDLAGLTDALDGLADLGVTVIYLNPIFAAPSNHRYDTSDYFAIDPDLGTLQDFDRLVAEAEARGIRIVLDGVFNHVSSDSPWFDRLARYEELGACESPDSPFRDWFTFRAPGPAEPGACAPSQPGGDDTFYVGWAGFDTIPELVENEAVTDLVAGPAGAVRTWLERGIGGWRLDVADSMSAGFQARIRDAAKAADPDALVIAEQWHDSTPWLLGDQADSTMDYRFRRAAIGLVNGATADPDGAIEGLSPSSFAAAMLGVREDYPAAANRVLMHLVDSHDTARILWTLTPGPDDPAAKTEPAALAVGKERLRLVDTLLLTFPGMASIFYGDEVGLTGHDDPDDRRPYPWGQEDLELREHVRTLARLRAEHEALREGDLIFLHADDAARTLAFLRRSPTAAAVVALNLGDRPRDLDIEVAGDLPDGLELTDALGGVEPVTTSAGRLRVSLPPRRSAVLVSADDADLVAPPAPATITARGDPVGGTVELAWGPSPGAAGMQVWRSLLAGGGYERVAEVPADVRVYRDTSVRDGVAYHYVITAVDEAGNISTRSPEAVARLEVPIAEVALLGLAGEDGAPQPSAQVVLSATDGLAVVEVAVRSDAATERVADGVVVEVGLGPAGSEPAAADGWSWWRADEIRPSKDGVVAQGTVRPESAGPFAVGARVTTDGGASWRIATGRAELVAMPGLDTDPPPAPGAPELLDVSSESVRLRWAASDAGDLFRYVVLRGPSADGPFEVVARPGDPVYVDSSVAPGEPYVYRVAAQDTSFNTSAPSGPLEVEAAERVVDVTFTVSVPPHTTPGDTVFIAGDFQGWDPGGTPMTPLDASTWTISLPFEDGTPLQYKYTRGSWESVEKDGACGELANRTLAVSYGPGASQALADEVAKWRDLDGCG